jgi:5-formyltetrahydrofolate cyclo-ligase
MKNSIRKEILKQREMLSLEKIEELSHSIYNNIINWDKYNRAKRIMTYYAFRNEVLTDELIEKSLNNNKDVILPKSLKEDRKILPCKITSIKQLIKGTYGIMEPPEDIVIP